MNPPAVAPLEIWLPTTKPSRIRGLAVGPPGLEPPTVRLWPDGQALPADRDPSRPGQPSLAVFKTAAFDRSATSPATET